MERKSRQSCKQDSIFRDYGSILHLLKEPHMQRILFKWEQCRGNRSYLAELRGKHTWHALHRNASAGWKYFYSFCSFSITWGDLLSGSLELPQHAAARVFVLDVHVGKGAHFDMFTHSLFSSSFLSIRWTCLENEPTGEAKGQVRMCFFWWRLHSITPHLSERLR